MKRLVIAVSIFFAIILACLGDLCYLSHHIDSMVQSLTLSQQALSQGENEHCMDLLHEAYEKFNHADFVMSITINEKQLDEVSLNFARTLQGIGESDSTQFAMELAALKESIIDLKRTELPTLGNLL